MTQIFEWYILAWVSACLFAVLLIIRQRNDIELLQKRYWRYLFQGWKVVTFLIAAVGLITIAPYTGDPTWDYFDAAFMSLLTFATAPWTVGILYRAIYMQAGISQIYVAVILWLFSASWSYDIYLVIRDGQYPVTWLSNMFASTVLYVSAGLLWNLTWRKGQGVIFGFMASDWLEAGDGVGFAKIFWFALPFMILVVGMILPFVY